MKAKKTVYVGNSGKHIAHEGIKYRPLIASDFKEGEVVLFNLPHPSTGDSWATVSARGVTETWEPQV